MVTGWSHFKPEFSGKQEEDSEAYILRIIDWMDIYSFLQVKAYQPLNIEDELVDVNVIDPVLNTDFEENDPQ